MVPRTRSSGIGLPGQQDDQSGGGDSSAQTSARPVPSRDGNEDDGDASDSSASFDPSLLDQLRARLGDDPDLMDDRYYLSALLAADGDVEEAARLIEQQEDFELIDEALLEDIEDTGYGDIDNLVGDLESVPRASELAGNPGPWNPRPGDLPTLTNQERRAIGIFEDMVYPRTIDQDVVVDYLEEHNWDIAAAHAEWVLDRDEVMRREQGQASSRPDTDQLNLMMDSGVPFNANVEQERRDAARLLRDAVNAVAAVAATPAAPVAPAAPAGSATTAGTGSLLSISEALLLLVNNNFNLTSAFRDFIDRKSAQEDLSAMYDHMRVQTTSRAEQDERLAILATLTQRVDLAALEGLLIAHQWDLIRAIVAWYKDGVHPGRHVKDKDTNKSTYGWNRRCDAEGTPLPMPKKEDTAVASRVEKGWALEVKEYAAGGKNNKPTAPVPKGTSHLGAVIDEDIRTVPRGPPRPIKLRFEAIWNGKYWSGTFKHSEYRWIDQDHPDFAKLDGKTQQALLKKPLFDWEDQDHLEDLNKWRRQRHQRATSNSIRPASQPFSQEERDYLYQLSKEHVEDLMASNGQSWDQCTKLAVSEKVKRDWARKFNAKFVGTMPHPHRRPIQPRNPNSLMTQRGRIDKIRKDFNLRDGTAKEDKEDDGEEEDNEEDSEEDSDDDVEMADPEE